MEDHSLGSRKREEVAVRIQPLVAHPRKGTSGFCQGIGKAALTLEKVLDLQGLKADFHPNSGIQEGSGRLGNRGIEETRGSRPEVRRENRENQKADPRQRPTTTFPRYRSILPKNGPFQLGLENLGHGSIDAPRFRGGQW
jgi:hypothetical protein